AHSYFVIFTKDPETGLYSIRFERGPERKAVNKVYGTALVDPSSLNGDVLLMGGIIGTNNLDIGPGKVFVQGASIAASLERWKAPTSQQSAQGINWKNDSSWTFEEDFLARIDEDILIKSQDIVNGKVKNLPLKNKFVKQSSYLGRYGKRAMEQAVILPTKEILVVNGGNYAEVRPVYNPTLLIPDSKNGHQGFRTKLMNPDVEPRVYHNSALLLPDARVLVLGGNNSRAFRYDVDGKVYLDTKNDFEFVEKGSFGNSGEIWQHAIFYPPYLFGESVRPEIIAGADKLKYGESQTISVANVSTNLENQGSLVLIKFGSGTHSFDNGQKLIDLKFSISSRTDESVSSIEFTTPSKDEFVPPGYYMLFYINSEGKPSHAKIVQLKL
ncbi:MAG: galactose oxidase early set domain-containing protein, partial [Brasilonema sp.]